jgi:methylmalonyl-CoA epimerase
MSEFTLDHVVIAARDLDAATAHYTALLGRQPSWQGEHPSYGTRNTLYRMANTYVELLAPGDGKQKGPWRVELGRFLERGEGLYALALGTPDIAASTRALRERGLGVLDPADGSGTDLLSGARRAWRNAMVPVKQTNGVRLFFIEHLSPPDALPVAAAMHGDAEAARRLDHVVVLSPDMEASRRLWQHVISARMALDRTFPDRDRRLLFFRLGDITVEISGGAQQTAEGVGKPDRMWGLAWDVPDVAATVERLRGAGIEASDVRQGVKPGTLVATVKGDATHGVATLLIEHTPQSFEPESRAPVGAAYDNAPERRAFRALGLDHVALAVEDIDEAAVTWRNTLGLEVAEAIDAVNAPVRLAKLPAGSAFVQLTQALSPEHRLALGIGERGPGMYAVAVEVDNIDAAAADLRAKGVLVSDIEYGAWGGTRVARVNPSATNGVQMLLVQKLPDVL